MTEKPVNIDEGTIRELNEQMVKGDLVTSDTIYLDLAFFRDIYLGTLLTFLTAPLDPDIDKATSYKYIINQITKYRERDFIDIATQFPDMRISNAQILERMQDPNFSNMIYSQSPMTEFPNTFMDQLKVNINNSRVMSKRDAITVVVNTYPLELSRRNKDMLGLFMMDHYRVTVQVVCRDPASIGLDEWLKFDEMYLFYIKEVLDNENIRHSFTELKFINKYIYAPRFFGYKTDLSKNLKMEALQIQTAMDVMCNFRYVEMSKLSPPDVAKH